MVMMIGNITLIVVKININHGYQVKYNILFWFILVFNQGVPAIINTIP